MKLIEIMRGRSPSMGTLNFDIKSEIPFDGDLKNDDPR